MTLMELDVRRRRWVHLSPVCGTISTSINHVQWSSNLNRHSQLLRCLQPNTTLVELVKGKGDTESGTDGLHIDPDAEPLKGKEPTRQAMEGSRHVVIKSEAGVFPAMLTPKKPIPRLGYHHRLNAIKELYDTILQSVVLFQPRYLVWHFWARFPMETCCSAV
ncbi:hypothetical protein ASPNIDRAFT_44135 [Aspergillus niger ATCC 1015]|uniref:Uncharacterized protein n=1 Tax=Aspergillus niger (strain ATCC 1015 / CBS 113.46 / FGSC A1144 / LSHB Ac4 / NCTC 3858a / NRRL 328 / USDA 3528.7) TaxID=380704 RepID=G3Y8T9_ASPNA|nr:hypothetical protein ASPNIDRAFT_44135 [Aspergillus niger ATCC 1015]